MFQGRSGSRPSLSAFDAYSARDDWIDWRRGGGVQLSLVFLGLGSRIEKRRQKNNCFDAIAITS